MTKKELNAAFDKMSPDSVQKKRMLYTILTEKVPVPKNSKRKICFSTAAACLVLSCTMLLTNLFGGGTVAFAFSVATPDGNNILMEDVNSNGLSASVSYVDNGPSLRFYITGEDIAKIEISSKNEFISAHDWTKTLDEKYWNPSIYYTETEIDGKIYQYVPAKSTYTQNLELNFPENFTEYDQVWYTWYGWNLRDWASEDNYTHIQGYDSLSVAETDALLDSISEEEKLAIAAGGGDTSAAGHILLNGYPEDKLQDTVTITLTDRKGNTSVKTLTIHVSNNSFGQTVVTANMEN